MASRSTRRAAASAPTDVAVKTAQQVPQAIIPETPVEPTPELVAPVPPEPTYSLEIRLASPALSGDSAYHVTWPESRVRALLAGKMDWIPVPVRAHLPGQAAPNAARYVYIQNIAEVIIHGWPQD